MTRSEEDDAEAPTLAGETGTLADRTSRPVINTPTKGTMVGRYQLEARLGAGAMGVVWSARDPELERHVAIKLVHPALHSDESASRFRREARAMAKLSHRSVITVHDTGVVDGQLFLAMELVRGTTLGQLLRERDAAAIGDWPRWLAMLLDAGRGLAEAHRNGVLHRDFKPDNVLVDKVGRVCVGDFGLASLGDRPAQRPSASTAHPITAGDSNYLDLTTTGAVLGTPLYMSPQQLNAEAIDACADQFSFCVALHEAMYGKRPFSTTAQGLAAIPSLIDEIKGGAPPAPVDSTVPQAIHDAIARGLAFEPEDRWPDMDTLIAALEQAGRRRGNTVMKPTRMPRWVAIAIPIGLAVVVVLAVILSIQLGRSADSPDSLVTASEQGSAPPPKVALIRLFPTPLNTRTAISADGRFVALGGEVIEVRGLDPEGGVRTINTIATAAPALYLEVDDQEVRFSTDGDGRRWRWRYLEAKQPVEIDRLVGWRGTTTAGELVRIENRGLAIAKRNGDLERWPVQNIEIAVISPDRRRVAYIDGGRFTGTISVRDVITGAILKSPSIEEPTSLAWLGPTTLIYTTSTMITPKIYRVEIGNVIGEPTVIHEQATGWFSDLIVNGKSIFVVSMMPTRRGLTLDLNNSLRSELDSVSLGLGWDASDRLVKWSMSNQQISSHAGKLDGEPANTTRSGDTLIASVRALGGRRAMAVSLSTGAGLWRLDDKRTIAIRCAGDRMPPCFAIRYVDEDKDQVVTLDPTTGVLGTTVIYEGRRIEDLAVRADGGALLITRATRLVEIDPDGRPLSTMVNRGTVRLSLIRSVAYLKDGFLVAGTIGRNSNQIGRMRDGVYEPLDVARDRILLLVRPSADESKILFIARGYEPELFRMQLP